MPFITSVVRIEDASGNRIDAPNPEGQFSPIVLALGNTLRGTATANGATTKIVLDAVGGGGSGAVTLPDHDAFRAIAFADLTDGAIYTFQTDDPGPFVYFASEGAGEVDDNRTILKPTGVSLGSNGRARNVNTSPVLPTFATARLATSGKQASIQIQNRSSTGDGGGGVFDYDATDTTTADNDGTFLVAGTRRLKRRYAGALHTEWFGLTPSSAVVHDGNGTDTTKATANKAALLAAFAVAQANGGREILAPVGNFPITFGASCFKITSYSGVILRGQGKGTVFFDPSVAATVSEGAAAGACFWVVTSSKVRFQNLRIIGSADYAAQVPVGLIRTDKKGTYFQNQCFDCGVDDIWYETVEGEVFYFDGTLVSPPMRTVARNMHTLDCIANMWNSAGAGVDCGVDGLFVENAGQSVLQIGGDNVFARNIKATRTNAIKTAADVFLIYARTFTIEDFELSGFDNRNSTANMIVCGFAAGVVKGTLRNGKLNGCKIATDSGNHNGMIKFFAGEQFVPGDDVKIQGVAVSNIELNDCGGSAGIGSKIAALSFTGGVTNGDDMSVTVTNLKIRNGIAGNVNRVAHVHDDIIAANRIQINPTSHDIQGVGADPYKFEVAVWKDYASTRRITGLTDPEKLASLIAQLTANGAFVQDLGFQPEDFTTAGVRAYYDANRNIQLGTAPRLTGTSPQITLSGDLQQPLGLKVKVTTGGARGTAKFDWSIDNGATWVATGVFTAASVILEQIGIMIAFPVGTYVLNDTYEATVEKWYDVIGGLNGPLFLVQATAAKQFLYRVTGGPNGKPALSAGGSDCYMAVSYTRPAPSYVYSVLEDDTAFGVGNETALDGLSSNRMRLFRSANTEWTMTETGGVGELLALPGADPQNFHVLELFFNDATSEGLEDGVSLGAGTVGVGAASGGLSIGAFGGSSAFFHGSFCKIVDLDADPSSDEKTAYRASLQSEFAI